MIMRKIIEQIDNNQSFLVVAHENPDGDAIGSTLGLALALTEMGKSVTAFNRDGVPDSMKFLPGSDQIVTCLPDDSHFDVAFVLDSGELERTGLPIQDLCSCIINIDHHPYSSFGDICFVDTQASATAVLICRLLSAAGQRLELSAAKALYLGILSDTGSFRYSSTNAEAFDMAGQLIGLGIDPWEIASSLYESHAPERMRLLGQVLPTLEISLCGRYASMAMTTDNLRFAGAKVEHADGFVNYPRSVRGVEVAMFFSQIGKDGYKVSFRSRGTIDVGHLARELGGGGHHNAAGVKMSGSLEEIRAKVARSLERLLG